MINKLINDDSIDSLKTKTNQSIDSLKENCVEIQLKIDKSIE